MTSPYILLKNSKVYPKKQLGQNFLADPSTAATIISRSNISSDDVVLEIGAGLGALTIPSAGISKKVYAIEKDRHIIPLLEKELALNGIENVIIIKDNILNIDINALAEKEGVKMTVIGNLPYNISSQILIRLIAARNNINSAVLMFQKELGQRIAAGPGGKQYGRVSVMLQYCADIKPLYRIKARMFYPMPKVDSEVLEICFHDTPRYPAKDEALFFKVVKSAFGKRRKTLRNSLAGSELDMDTEKVIHVLKKAEINPVRRAETLSVEEFVRLSNCIKSETIQGIHVTGKQVN